MPLLLFINMYIFVRQHYLYLISREFRASSVGQHARTPTWFRLSMWASWPDSNLTNLSFDLLVWKKMHSMLDSQKLFFLRVMCVHGKAWRYHSHAGYAIWDIILPNGHFTKRHFAERTVCRMDFLPKRLHAEKTICRMDNLPKMELSTANELRNESSSQTIWIDDDDAGDDVRLRNFI